LNLLKTASPDCSVETAAQLAFTNWTSIV